MNPANSSRLGWAFGRGPTPAFGWAFGRGPTPALGWGYGASLAVGLCAVCLLVGCAQEEDFGDTNPYPHLNPATMEFPDDVKTNASPPQDLLKMPFVDQAGKPVELKAFLGKKNLLLVVMRGFPGFVCPGCTAQTSRLIRNRHEFEPRETEVLIVFPGPADRIQDFVNAAQSFADGQKLPYPLLLDRNFEAIDRLGIRGELAKPSTYIVDKQGRIRFAYVGSSLTDRPSLKAMLREIDAIRAEEAAGSTAEPTGTAPSPTAAGTASSPTAAGTASGVPATAPSR